MILLATFIATGSSSAVPRITVEQIQAPQYGGGEDPVGKTQRTCEMMGAVYKASLSGKLPSGTTVVMTCMPTRSAEDS